MEGSLTSPSRAAGEGPKDTVTPWTRWSPARPRPSPTSATGVAGRRRLRPLRHPQRCSSTRCSTQGADATSASSPTTAASTAAGLGVLLGDHRIRADDRVLRRGEQGVRPAVPRRRARGRAHPAGHARRAAARRRRRASRRSTPRPASAPRSPTAACRGATTPTARSRWPRRPRRPATFGGRDVRARGGDRHRLRARARRGRATGTATSSSAQTARNFNPLCGDGRRGSPSPRSSSSSSPARSTRTTSTLPGIFVQRVVVDVGRRPREKRIETPDRARARPRRSGGEPMALTRDELAARAAQELQRRPVRQPRHRAADAGAQLPARRRHGRRCRARTASSASGPYPYRGRRGPRPDQRRQGDRHACCPARRSSTRRRRSA